MPALVVSVGIVYFSIGYNGYLSTLDWDGLHPDRIGVGLDNYERLAEDPVIRQTLENGLVYFLVTLVVATLLGFWFAVILHSHVRLAVVYKVLVFVPIVLAPAVMAPVFRQMFAANGQVNATLELLGLGALTQPWLAQSSTALWVIVSIGIWERTGLFFILYYAAISQIEPEIIEAARVDGAGNLRTVSSMVWPNVRGTTVALSMLHVIYSLKLFDVPFLVSGGGPNHATEFLGTYIYRVIIRLANVGYGAAISILLLAFAVSLAFIISRQARREGAG